MATVVSKTVGPGRDYETLAAWVTGEARDLVTADEIAEAVCHDFEDGTTDLDSASWTTDSTRFVRIVGASTLPKTFSTSHYRILATDISGIQNAPAHTVFRDLQITVNRTVSHGTVAGLYLSNGSSPWTVDRCRLRMTGAGTGTAHGITSVISSATVRARNVEAYGWNSNGIQSSGGAGGKLEADNCTAYDNGSIGIYTRDGYIRNCVSQANGGNDVGFAGNGVGSYNITSDATGTGTGSLANTTVTFVDAANGDFEITSGESEDAGTSDPSSLFDYDFLGVTRPQGSAWDIGSREIAAADPLTQTRYRWRLDDGSETTATWAAAEDTGITIPANERRRLRIQLQTDGDQGSVEAELRFRKQGSGNDYEAVP